jgi:RHS repeat-associated protein
VATFTVTTIQVSGDTTAVLTATFNNSSAIAPLTVTGSRIDQLQMSPQSVVGGQQASGNIILAAPAPEEGLSVTLRSSDPAVIVPSEMAMRGGARSGAFTVTTTPVSRSITATISAVLDDEQHNATLAVAAPSIAAFAFAPRTVRGGSSVTGTITLDGAASERGITIGIDSDSRLLTVPATVSVAAGEGSVTFTGDATIPVESEVPVTVSGTLGERVTTASLSIVPPMLTGLSVNPSSAVGGDPVTATPTIDGRAAASGAAVTITASDPSLVAAPSGTAIPAGATTTSVQLPTNPVAATTPVIVSASRQGVTRSTTITLVPPPVTLASFTLASTSVIGTNDVAATLTLTGPAPAPGVEVELTSSNPPVASVPPVVTVPAGVTSATFIVATSLVTADTQVTITALHATTAMTALLSILHPSGNYVASVAITPAFIIGGTSASGMVTLALPSNDHGGSNVALTSSNAALSVPASVKVNPNATTATFTLAASVVTAPMPVVIFASYGGVTQRMKVVVAPQNAVTLASLTIAPNRVTGGSPALATVTLNRPAPFGGAQVTIEARRRTIVTVPNAVVVPEGATFATFTIATDPLHAARDKSVEIVATYNTISASATLTVLPSAQAAATHTPVAICASLALLPCVAQSGHRVIKPLGVQDGGPPPPTGPTLFERQYTFYTPELSFLSETASTSSTTAAPVVAYDYVWFGGQPLAQIENATGNIAWYFNDHLGTPILQGDATGRVLWQAEYEPYGTVYAIRRGEARHQPLRLPGQTAEDGSELYQNVFRFYRARWGRYTQADPIRLSGGLNLFGYASGDPVGIFDPLGLRTFNWSWGPPPHASLDPAGSCQRPGQQRPNTRVACTNFLGASIDCVCRCGGSGWEPHVTLHVSLEMYVLNGPIMPGMAHDRSIHGFDSAVDHELNKHVRKGVDAVKSWLDSWMKDSYSTKDGCEGDCSTASGFDPSGIFRNAFNKSASTND